MRHGLNANYYANHNRPGMAIREGAAAVYDEKSGRGLYCKSDKYKVYVLTFYIYI
jgi:hypothetical protein